MPIEGVSSKNKYNLFSLYLRSLTLSKTSTRSKLIISFLRVESEESPAGKPVETAAIGILFCRLLCVQ